MDTYITLSILLGLMVYCVYFVLRAYFSKEKKNFTTLNLPLDNKGKWWYN
jgi:hypothetical protein